MSEAVLSKVEIFRDLNREELRLLATLFTTVPLPP